MGLSLLVLLLIQLITVAMSASLLMAKLIVLRPVQALVLGPHFIMLKVSWRLNEKITIESIIGSTMTVEVAELTNVW